MKRESLIPCHRPIACVVGARPNFIKMAPIVSAFRNRGFALPHLLIHTGQHYDVEMNDRLFIDLKLPAPDINLDVGSGTHAVQTAEVMRRFEPVLDKHRPSCVLVVGDVNSTLACSLVAVKKGYPVAHVEAGLRSHDRTMPEEINRVLTDQVAERLYTTERSAHENLAREGIDPQHVCFVGNVMIDTLLANLRHAPRPRDAVRSAGHAADIIDDGCGYGVVTLHRPSNVDQVATLGPLLSVLGEVAQRLPLVFAMHPRTRANIDRFGLTHLLSASRIVTLPPQGYLAMLGLVANSKLALTDSGGLQEESTALGVPCLTIRQNTERPITVEQGTNTIVGSDRDTIIACVDEILCGGGKRGRMPELWDGHAAERIAADLERWLAGGVPQAALQAC